MWLNLTSNQLNQLDLTDYAERYLVDRLSVISGVAKIRISGGKKSVRVWLDPFLLSQYKVTVREVEEELGLKILNFQQEELDPQQEILL